MSQQQQKSSTKTRVCQYGDRCPRHYRTLDDAMAAAMRLKKIGFMGEAQPYAYECSVCDGMYHAGRDTGAIWHHDRWAHDNWMSYHGERPEETDVHAA